MAGTSRVNREVYARFCGRLVVKFHRPTRLAEKLLAPLRRKRRGSMTPKIRWRHYAENEMAPICRKFTIVK
jgi:hypothetical protein